MITLRASAIAEIIGGTLVGDDVEIYAPGAINSSLVEQV